MSEQVYILTNAEGETLYIGIAHYWPGRRTRHIRTSWWVEVAHVELIEVPDKPTARAMEWALIYSRDPIFNVQHRRLSVPWTGPPPAPRIRVAPYVDPRPAPPPHQLPKGRPTNEQIAARLA